MKFKVLPVLASRMLRTMPAGKAGTAAWTRALLASIAHAAAEQLSVPLWQHHETELGSARPGGIDDIQPQVAQSAAAAASNKSSSGRVIALATLTGVGDVGEALSVARAMHQICPELLGKGISFNAKGNSCGKQLLDQYQEVLPALAGQGKAANVNMKHQQGNAAAEKFVTAVVLPLEDDDYLSVNADGSTGITRGSYGAKQAPEGGVDAAAERAAYYGSRGSSKDGAVPAAERLPLPIPVSSGDPHLGQLDAAAPRQNNGDGKAGFVAAVVGSVVGAAVVGGAVATVVVVRVRRRQTAAERDIGRRSRGRKRHKRGWLIPDLPALWMVSSIAH
eukprot:gene9111-9280_t